MPCSRCGRETCICRPWCPSSHQCCGPIFNQYHCAGPIKYTAEDNIGDRPCCGGLKKCSRWFGNSQVNYCSHDGKCGSEDMKYFDYPLAPPPFTKYSTPLFHSPCGAKPSPAHSHNVPHHANHLSHHAGGQLREGYYHGTCLSQENVGVL
jgi:hypothetical protein